MVPHTRCQVVRSHNPLSIDNRNVAYLTWTLVYLLGTMYAFFDVSVRLNVPMSQQHTCMPHQLRPSPRVPFMITTIVDLVSF